MNITKEELTKLLIKAYKEGLNDMSSNGISEILNVPENTADFIIKDFLESYQETCPHPYKQLERNAIGLFCNRCKQQVSNNPNIY